MAHPINDLLNRIEKRKAIKCDSDCKYFMFAHLETACVLSDVYSVKKGELCFEYRLIGEQEG